MPLNQDAPGFLMQGTLNLRGLAMAKMNGQSLIFLLFFSLILFQGCASVPEKRFTGKDMSSLSPVKVITYKTAEIRRVTAGRTLAGALTLGLGSNAIAESGGRAMREKYALPDLGELIMKKFTEKIQEEVPGWPQMNIEEKPVERGYTSPGPLLVLQTFFIQVADAGYCHGFCAFTDIAMQDSKNNVVWLKRFSYRSKNFGREPKSFSDYEKENGKLLKEEMNFAAETTVSRFIEHFKGDKKQ
jgi:hypothetical protein